MNWVLGIDTSHHVAIGLARQGRPVDTLVVPDTRAHVEQLMPGIQQLLAGHGIGLADLSAVAVGMGPGPFTGLRVGVATAQTLAAVGAVPLYGVCSLDVLARQWDRAPGEFVVALDARRKELYWAHYVAGRRQGEPRVGPPGSLPQLPVAGPVPETHREALDWVPDGPRHLDPALLAALCRELPPAPEEPYYLRPADATVGGPPKSALPRLRARR